MKTRQISPQDELVRELVTLRQEVQQLRQMVNMLMDIVVEPEEDEEWGHDPTQKRGGGDRGGRGNMCM